MAFHVSVCVFVLPQMCTMHNKVGGGSWRRLFSGEEQCDSFTPQWGSILFSMLLRLMLAVGVSDAHPERLLLKPIPTYLRREREGMKRRNKKVKGTKSMQTDE